MLVVTSGYFNPLHEGHLNLLKEARNLGDYLVVIVNNDGQVEQKGSKPFMSESERMKLVEAIRYVDDVVLSIDKDRSITETLKLIRPHIFAKGGDSTEENTPELALCKELGIEVVFGVGGRKIQSSSNLLS